MLSQGNPAHPHGDSMIAEIEAAAGPYATSAAIYPILTRPSKCFGQPGGRNGRDRGDLYRDSGNAAV